MFDTFFGLPIHSLVIHAVVVLVPLCSLAVVLMLFSARWCERLRLPVLLLLAVGAGSAFVAKKSGEAFLARLKVTGDLMTRHKDLGTIAPFIVIAFFVLYAAWFWLSRERSQADSSGRVPLLALTAVVGVVALGWIVATGHAGSAATWQDVIKSTTPG